MRSWIKKSRSIIQRLSHYHERYCKINAALISQFLSNEIFSPAPEILVDNDRFHPGVMVDVLRAVLSVRVGRWLHDGQMLISVWNWVALDLVQPWTELLFVLSGHHCAIRGVRVRDPVVALRGYRADHIAALKRRGSRHEAVSEVLVHLFVVVGVEVGKDVSLRVSAVKVLLGPVSQ